MTTEFQIYHVARNCAEHSSRLDDRIYGAPIQATKPDWTLEDPKLYLKRLASELQRVEIGIDDMAYLLREKGVEVFTPEVKIPTLEEADAHVFHKFDVRQFGYVEKLSHQLNSKAPDQISMIIPKAIRQYNVLLAAREDLLVTKVRFENYLKNYKEGE